MSDYKSPAESAAIIRAALKAKGWNSKQISVRSESYSMGSSIDVKIRVAGISKAVVEAIANEQEEVRRDGYGDILSGGNRFVSVTFDSDLVEAQAAKLMPWLATLPLTTNTLHDVTIGEREIGIGRRTEWQYALFVDGRGTPLNDAHSIASCVARLAIEQGLQVEAPAPVEAEPVRVPTALMAEVEALDAENTAWWDGWITERQTVPEYAVTLEVFSELPGDRYLITTLSGVYLGEQRASSPHEARVAYAERGSGYYNAATLQACRIKPRAAAK